MNQLRAPSKSPPVCLAHTPPHTQCPCHVVSNTRHPLPISSDGTELVLPPQLTQVFKLTSGFVIVLRGSFVLRMMSISGLGSPELVAEPIVRDTSKSSGGMNKRTRWRTCGWVYSEATRRSRGKRASDVLSESNECRQCSLKFGMSVVC